MYGVRVSDIPVGTAERSLKIYFKDPKNGGGAIKTFYYPLNFNDAVIIFEEEAGMYSNANSVVNRLIQVHDDVDKNYRVQKLPEMVYSSVEAVVDPSFSASLFSQENDNYLNILKFEGDVEVQMTKDGCIKLKGTWFQLEWAWMVLEQIQEKQLQIQKHIQRSLSTGSQTGESLVPFPDTVGAALSRHTTHNGLSTYGNSDLNGVSNGRLSPVGGREHMDGLQTGTCQDHEQAFHHSTLGSLDSVISPFPQMDSVTTEYNDNKRNASGFSSPSHVSKAIRQSDADETFRMLAENTSTNDLHRASYDRKHQPDSSISSRLSTLGRDNADTVRNQTDTRNDGSTDVRDSEDISYMFSSNSSIRRDYKSIRQDKSSAELKKHVDRTSDLEAASKQSSSPIIVSPSLDNMNSHMSNEFSASNRKHNKDMVHDSTKTALNDFFERRSDLPNDSSSLGRISPNETLWSAQTNPSNLNYNFHLPGGISVTIGVRDITHEKSGVIVNAANSILAHFGGVAKAIAEAADPKMMRECNEYIAKHGSLKNGKVLRTCAGGRFRDSVAHIFHVAGPVYTEAFSNNCQAELVEVFLSCLKEAERIWVTSISFPMISAGVFGVPLDICMQSFMDALVLFANERPGHVKDIRMVNTLSDAVCSGIVMIQQIWELGYERVLSDAKKRLDENQKPTYSFSREYDLPNAGATWHGTDNRQLDIQDILGRRTYNAYDSGDREYSSLRDDRSLDREYSSLRDDRSYTIDIEDRQEYHSLREGFRTDLSERNKSTLKPVARKARSSSTSRLPSKKANESESGRHIYVGDSFKHDTKGPFKSLTSNHNKHDNRSSSYSLDLNGQRSSLHDKHAHSSQRGSRSSSSDRNNVDMRSDNAQSSQSVRKRSNSFNMSRDSSHKTNKSDSSRYEKEPERGKMSSASSTTNHKMPTMKQTLATRSTSKVKSVPSVTSPVSSARQPMKASATLSTDDRLMKKSSFSQRLSLKDHKKSPLRTSFQEYENDQLSPRLNYQVNSESDDTEEDCVICMEKIVDPKVLSKCKHKFCSSCIKQHFQKCRPSCPTCGILYGTVKGNQPTGGKMSHYVDEFLKIPGYETYRGAIVITYDIPSGTQTSEHPDPGRRYSGIYRTAYLPNNKEGNEILKLLQKAFKLRLIFTVGDSRTTGQAGVVTWNDIHHKTNLEGGPTKFGYPDPTYMTRVREELAAKGIASQENV